VSFSTNGNNEAKSTTATFGTNGVYDFQVVIRDQDGQMALSPTSGVVSVTVTQAVATFTVSPASLWLFAGATQQFTAANAADQFGIAMSVVPANYEWSAGGAGTIDTGTNVATLVAGATAGSYMVTSRYGTATATASVLVATELVWDGTLNDWQTAHWSNPVGGLTVPQEGISYAVTSGTASATATPFPGAPLRIAAGGTLSVENSATSTGVVTLAGGTVTCAGNYSLSALNGLVAGAGANTIDVAANTLTLPLAVTGAGSLTKQGAGTLRLAGNNTYTGLTTVNNGTLLVDGSLAASGTVSLAGGTLGGTGTVGTVTSSATLSPGHGATMGTLTASNLVLTAGCTNAFDLGVAGASDSVAVNGTLTLGGGVVTVLPQAGFDCGTYTLFSYGTSSGVTPPTPITRFLGYSLTVTNNATAHQVQLIVTEVRGSVYTIR
jgi:autotransporter-associated beta strand protein